MQNLTYHLSDEEPSEAMKQVIASARKPEHPIMFPHTSAELTGRCRAILRENEYDIDTLTEKTGLPEERIQGFLDDSIHSLADAMSITKALGYDLMRVPTEYLGNS